MAKSPSKFDATTLTNALKQVYYIHKNIVADLNAKLDVLADENEKLQAQKSSAMSGECSSCSHLKDMNQRLQETFNALLKDKEAAIKSLRAQLGELSSGKSGKHLDTPESLESSKLLENKVKRREEESHKAQRDGTVRNNVIDENSTSRNDISDATNRKNVSDENSTNRNKISDENSTSRNDISGATNRKNVSDENSTNRNINDENSTGKTHSKLQLPRQGKRSIRYTETQEVPSPKRTKVSPTSNPARLTVSQHSCYTDSVKWAAMLVPETEPTAIEKNHEPEDACEIEELSEHMLVVPETVGLDYTIRNVECDVGPQEGNVVECESNNGPAAVREGSLFSAKNNSKMSGQNAEDGNSHSLQTEESQEPCTQIANRKVSRRDNPNVLKAIQGVGEGKPTDELPNARNQSGTVCAVGLQSDVVKGAKSSNKLDPKRKGSNNLPEDNGRSRKKSHEETDVQSSVKPVLASTESKLSDAKENTEQSRSKPGQTSKNLGSNFEKPTSPSFPKLSASKVSPNKACHLGQRNSTDTHLKVSGDNNQSKDPNRVTKQVSPPSDFLGDAGDLRAESRESTVGRIREFHFDLNGSLNPDVSLSELLASQVPEKVVRGRTPHSQSYDEVMNAFDETIAPSSLLQHGEMLRPDLASPVKSSQQFSSTLNEDTLKATQNSSPAPNQKRSLLSTSPKNFKTSLKSFVLGGKVDSGKSRSQVTNPQQKTSLYKSSGIDDELDVSVVVSDDDDDESIAPSPQGNSLAGSQLHCSIPSSSRSFKFSHQPNKFHARLATTAGKLIKDTTKTSASNLSSVSVPMVMAKKSATNRSSVGDSLVVATKSETNPSRVSVPLFEAKKSATSPRSVSIRLVGEDGESLDLQAALEEIDRSQNFHEENLPQPTTEVMSPQKSSLHVSPVQSFEDSFDRVPKNKVVEFPHVAVVRKRNEREKLEGFSCRECYEYYKNCGLSDEEMKQRMNQCSKHRHKFVAPATPEHFWSLGFPDTAEIMERSTLPSVDNETPAPKEKGHRRRRRLEKKF